MLNQNPPFYQISKEKIKMFDTIKLKFNKNDLDFVKRYANEENLDLDACCKKNSFRLS